MDDHTIDITDARGRARRMRGERRLLSAVAARLGAVLLVELDGVVDLHERGEDVASLLNEAGGASGGDGSLDVLLRALAAVALLGRLLGGLGLAGRLVALELALGAGAGGGLLALPVALGLLAHGGADGLRGDARGAAVGGRADGLALGAVLRLAHLLGAAHVALGLVAVHLAASASGLLALDLALGALAHGVALGGASGVVALPTALRVAVASLRHRLSRNISKGQSQNQQNSDTHSSIDEYIKILI